MSKKQWLHILFYEKYSNAILQSSSIYMHTFHRSHTQTHTKRKKDTLLGTRTHSVNFHSIILHAAGLPDGWLRRVCVCVFWMLYCTKPPPFETIKTAKERQWVFNNKMFSNKILTCKHSVWKYWKHIWIDGPTTTSTPYLLIKLPKQISQFPSYNNCGSTESKNYVYYSGILLAFSCLFYWLYYANKKKAFVCLFAGTHPHPIRNCAFFPHD